MNRLLFDTFLSLIHSLLHTLIDRPSYFSLEVYLQCSEDPEIYTNLKMPDPWRAKKFLRFFFKLCIGRGREPFLKKKKPSLKGQSLSEYEKLFLAAHFVFFPPQLGLRRNFNFFGYKHQSIWCIFRGPVLCQFFFLLETVAACKIDI